MPNQVMANGKNYDWGDVEVVMFGIPLVGVTNITYNVNQGTVNNPGAGYEPVSYGRKMVEYTGGKITMYLEEARAIAQSVPSGRLMDIPPFSFPVTFGARPGSGVPFQKDTVNNVRFTSDPFNTKSGDTSIMVDITFDFAGVDKQF